MAGWDVYFRGTHRPAFDILKSVVERRADVLAVSTTLGCQLHRTPALIDTIRADPRCARLRILVGGHPFNVDADLWRTFGADGTGGDAGAVVRVASGWRARRPALPPPLLDRRERARPRRRQADAPRRDPRTVAPGAPGHQPDLA